MNKRFSLKNFGTNEITRDTYIQFHKLIDDGDEKGAIELLKKYGDSFNVNYEYKMKLPIFSAINKNMNDLFDEIVNHYTFDGVNEDGFGESLLHSLLYLRGGAEELQLQESEKANIDRMIRTLLNSNKQDLNAVDLNNDTAINISCEYPNLLWITEDLVNREYVNPNIINDFSSTALTNAIRNDNIDAIKLLSKRKDLIVRDKDIELATKHGINLSEYGL
jgi:5'-3' exonuclease